MKKTFLGSMFASALIAINLFLPSAVSAQAYRSQLHFLEEFAIRQYERGNMANASKEFQRILRIQPENALAREYLQKIATLPGTPQETKANIDQIIHDISNVKEQLNDYEKDAKELEYMIRNLITENDALYQSLYKRSREVVEMREKFYGTPYGDAYADVMKDIPIDRVPQRLHPSNDILPDEESGIGIAAAHAPGSFANAVDTHEVNALIADINNLAQRNLPLKSPLNGLNENAMPLNTTISQLDELREALESKRDTLIDTTVATAEKQQNLEKIRDELTATNTSLKQGVDRYVEAINKIDNYYGSIKADIAKKNFNEQKLFSELVADYADKVKEIEELKRSVQYRDKNMTSFKSTLAAENMKIDDLKKVMALRDKQLANLKSLLVQYKKQLNERDALIQLQQSDLTMADKKLKEVQKRITAIEGNLNDNAQTITQLNKSVDATRTYLEKQEAALKSTLHDKDQTIHAREQTIGAKDKMIVNKEEMIRSLEATTARNDIHVKKVEAQDAALAARLALHEKALGTSGKRIHHLERRLATVAGDLNSALATKEDVIEKPFLDKISALSSDLSQKKTLINELQKKIDAAPTEQKRMQEEAATLKKTLTETNAQKDDAFQKLDEAAQKIATLERSAQAKDQRLAELSDAIAQLQTNKQSLHPVNNLHAKDDTAEIQDLKRRLRHSQNLLSAAEITAARHTAMVTELNAKLAARDVQIEQLKALSTVNQSDELKALKRQLADQNAAMAELSHHNRAMKDQLEKNINEPASTTVSPSIKTSADSTAPSPSLTEMKTEAANRIINERDQEIIRLSNGLKALKKELIILQNAQKEIKTKQDNAIAAQMLAEGKLQQRETELATLEVKIKDLRNDIKAASDLLDKKTRDNTATLNEVKRLNDVIEKKNSEIADLQLRIRK